MAKKEIVLFTAQDPKTQSAFVRGDEYITVANLTDRHIIGIEMQDKMKVMIFKLCANKYYPYWIGDNVNAHHDNDRCEFDSISNLLVNLRQIYVAYAFNEPHELYQWLITDNRH